MIIGSRPEIDIYYHLHSILFSYFTLVYVEFNTYGASVTSLDFCTLNHLAFTFRNTQTFLRFKPKYPLKLAAVLCFGDIFITTNSIHSGCSVPCPACFCIHYQAAWKPFVAEDLSLFKSLPHSDDFSFCSFCFF